ncbi:MAG: hypothetical protein HAW67_05115, partial [Endozoicomonadaceae bacterium]|nr:hypothetical protein [Endozoicomonadaceae bacterium]
NYDSKYTDYIQHNVGNILGMLKNYIEENPEVQSKLQEKSIMPNYSYTPKPNPAWKITTGSVIPTAPITDKGIAKISVANIAQNLRKEWTAEKLDKLNSPENRFNRMHVSGVGDLLETDISNRPNEYCKYAELFLDIDAIDPHYTYSYFEGMTDALKSDQLQISKDNLTPIINLCKMLVTIGNGKLLLKVNNAMGYSDAIKSMISFFKLLVTSNNQDIKSFMQENRGTIIEIIKLLLTSDDPRPEAGNILGSGHSLTKGTQGTQISDPLMIAINSIRGCAYQLFVNFTCMDSNDSIAKDIKVICERLLQEEETRAIFFLFGHYFLYFYHRDKAWMNSQISKILPEEETKKHLYTAAWEGMLSRQVHPDIIVAPPLQKIYLRGFDLTDKDFPAYQAQFINPSQQLAETIAVAYLNVSDFDKNSLYKKLWEKGNINHHRHFMNQIGRMAFSGQINNNFWQARFEALWENILQDKNKDSKILKELGNSITLQDTKFKAKWLVKMLRRTLEATDGQLSEYYRIREMIVELAKEIPEDTLEIIKLIMARKPCDEEEYDDIIGGTGEEWRDAFISIYKNANNIEDKNKRQDAKNELNAVLGELLKHHSLVFSKLVDNLDK